MIIISGVRKAGAVDNIELLHPVFEVKSMEDHVMINLNEKKRLSNISIILTYSVLVMVFFQKNVMLGLGKVTLVRERGEKERVKVKVCRELNLSSRSEVGLISSKTGRLNLQ